MPLYALTIFCGAFLLFLVQPLMGKYLLPWFGGGPGVWTTCLLFFQTLLLGGYAYAHGLQRFAPKRQAVVHVLLLAGSLAFLPVVPGAQWKPLGTEDPIARILLLLTATLGLPYLVLSATGPLLQRWFSLSHPGVSPYRLYALSNVGSLLALLAYPFFFEPRFSRGDLALGWSAGFVVFVILCAACAWRARNATVAGGADPGMACGANELPGSAPPATTEHPSSHLDRFLWFALPAIASVLLAATTNKLCLDLAAIPFLWVLPLGVYLLTFIITFDHPRWYARGLFAALLVLSCLLLAALFTISNPPLFQIVLALVVTLFVAGMVCHGELYRLRPAPGHLTGYYLAIAAGGASGSFFVTFGAPLLFGDYRELQLGLVLLLYFVSVLCWFQRSRTLVLGLAAGLVALPLAIPLLRADAGLAWSDWWLSLGTELSAFFRHHGLLVISGLAALAATLHDGWRLAAQWRPRMIAIPALLTVLVAAIFVRQAKDGGKSVYEATRNFYGAFKVFYYDQTSEAATHFFVLANADTTHGQQFAGRPMSVTPTTYYSETSGVGRAFAALPGGPRRIGAVGLGAGTIATYGRAGDSFRFYELNPAILDVATRVFTYLQNTPAKVSLVPGDARLVMERELRAGTAPQYDLLVVDAFSGDAIPVHLLTREAFALYVRQLRPGGIIAVHISNRHLNLQPVVKGLAREAGLHFAFIHDIIDEKDWWLYSTDWVLVSADPEMLQKPVIHQDAQEAMDSADAPTLIWTDDHASLLDVVK